MRSPVVPAYRRTPDSTRRRLPKRRDDSGLTTLEWLLIVAAVAGLAALAVVLVQGVVGDTAEQIAGSSARKTAATIAADEIMRDAQRDSSDQPASAKKYDDWEKYYKGRCDRLEIIYGDAGIETHERFLYTVKNATPAEAKSVQDVVATEIDTYLASGQTGTGFNDDGLSEHAVGAGEAVAHCVVADV